MENDELSGSLVSEFNHVPSGQMVIRRYQDLEERYIQNFFQKGPFCRHMPTFDGDNEEGLLGKPGYSDELRGGLAAVSSTRRGKNRGEIASVDEFEESLENFHEAVRHKHFANCWRLGTDEPKEMWEEYLDDEELKEGIAFETTVHQFICALPTEPSDSDFKDEASIDEFQETQMKNMHVGATGSDILIGAVRYQDREAEGTLQPASYQAAINFFKRKQFDYEREFRLLINPFDSARLLKANPDGTPLGRKPTVETEHRFLPMETKWMTNRIILAPNAGEEQREKLEDILDRIGINYGVEEKDDLEIIESSLHGPSRSETHEYDTEFAGQDNYEKTMDYLNDQHRKILENTEEEWSVVDLVMLFMEKAGVMVEGYRYSTDDPDIELNEYGHMKLQGVCATRNFVNGKDSITYKNDKMVEFEE